jgi:hypothetical protein
LSNAINIYFFIASYGTIHRDPRYG